jgi:hypothetical protein
LILTAAAVAGFIAGDTPVAHANALCSCVEAKSSTGLAGPVVATLWMLALQSPFATGTMGDVVTSRVGLPGL